jgi:hypothetical protein
MDEHRSKIASWEVMGALFIIILGSLLHFLFAWSGQWTPVALIAAVNESVWEHLKMVFWPGLIFMLLAYPFLKKKTHHFWEGKTIGLLSMPLIILVLFYAYHFVFKTHNLAYDIFIFILAVIFGQWISYRVLLKSQLSRFSKPIIIILLLIAVAAFSLFSFYPPRCPLFQDSRTGNYGIPNN